MAAAKKKVVAKRAAPKASIDADPVLPFVDRKGFATWLKAHHASSKGLWVKLAKKGAGVASITRDECVDEALCWGWIDGQARSIDATWWQQRFTPRRSRSIWSKINRDKVAALIASGQMKPPGLAEVERAQGDGRWDAAYDSPKNAAVPDDLAAALKKNAKAAKAFAGLSGQNRYAVLFRIHGAKKAETRARRIETFVAMLARGETLY